MNWKKWLSGLVVAGCLLVGGSVAPLWASEADMIDLLLKKNVITQEEADRMTDKIKSSAQQEKAEIKKELTEDIKKDAAKGEFIPSALKGFKFGTTIYSFWEGKNYFSGDNANTNKFILDRAYLTLTKDVNDWLGMNITADLYNSAAPTVKYKDGDTEKTASVTNNNTSYELRFKYVYADLTLFGTSTKIGLVPTPSDAYDGSIYPYRMQGKHLLDALSVQASADLGIVNQGVFGGYMDSDYLKYGNKSFGGKWGGYMIGLYNGAGYDYTTENNNNKTVSGSSLCASLPDCIDPQRVAIGLRWHLWPKQQKLLCSCTRRQHHDGLPQLARQHCPSVVSPSLLRDHGTVLLGNGTQKLNRREKSQRLSD